jgi:phage FluMu gp28-like protein
MASIKGLTLHKGQLRIKKEIFNSKAKFHIINASRQSGKTTLLHQLALYLAINTRCKILWVAPVYSISKKTFTEIVEGLQGSGAIAEYLKVDQSINFTNGSEIVFKSAQNYDNIRGGSYEYVFIDEFAYIADEAWTQAIRPTLAVKGIKAFIASTPKGRNLFFNLASLGMDPDKEQYQYHFMNYHDNPWYDLQEVADAKKTLPESIYLQEYEAEFVDDGGVVFDNLLELSTVNEFLQKPKSGDRYFAGLDLARQTDYTVLTIVNQRKEVVFVYRINKQSWELIVRGILKWLKIFKPVLYVEVNSIGDVIYENIKKFYKRAYPFVTTQSSKQDLIEELIYEFSDFTLRVPTKELMYEMYHELSIFTFEYSKKTRKIKYGAPSNMHDDTVISLALAIKATKKAASNQMSWTSI